MGRTDNFCLLVPENIRPENIRPENIRPENIRAVHGAPEYVSVDSVSGAECVDAAGRIGVDTLRLRVLGPEIDVESMGEDTALVINEGAVNTATGNYHEYSLFHTPGGAVETGRKAYVRGLSGLVVDILESGLYVCFSAPRQAYGTNVSPVPAAELPSVIRGVGATLKQQGLLRPGMDLMDARLSRVDLFRNIRLDRAPAAYRAVLERRMFPRMTRNVHTAPDGTTTLYWTASDRQLTTYNKSAEAALDDPHVQRFEYRLTNAKAIRRYLPGLKTARDLCAEYAAAGEAFRAAFRTLVEDPLPGDPPPAPLAGESLGSTGGVERAGPEALVEAALEADGAYRPLIQRALATAYLEEHAGLEEQLVRALRAARGPKAASRLRADIESGRVWAGLVDRALGDHVQLLGEVRQKVLGEAPPAAGTNPVANQRPASGPSTDAYPANNRSASLRADRLPIEPGQPRPQPHQ